MFSNKQENQGFNELDINSHNTIGAGTIISGEINIEGNVRIDGTIKGNVISKGKIVLGNTGVIEGEIECQHAYVSGKIKGKIIVHEVLSVKSSAELDGDVYYSKIEVDNGATINGSLIANNSNSNKKVASTAKKEVVFSEN